LEPRATEVLQRAEITDGDRILDIGTGLGLLAAAEAAASPSGLVVGIDRSLDVMDACLDRHDGIAGAVADATALPFTDAAFDVVTTFCVLIYVPDKQRTIAECFRVLRPGGRVSILEPVHQARLRYHFIPDISEFEPEHSELAQAHAALLAEHGAVLAAFDADTLAHWFVEAGFDEVRLAYELTARRLRASPQAHSAALARSPLPGFPSFADQARTQFGPRKAEQYLDVYARRLADEPSLHVAAIATLSARKPGSA
jgi:ubiquinone/menaquinone biosynthesis C-methylase UbiE